MTAPVARPNLLVIAADQLRHDWLGLAGTPGVSTPHIDALAVRGRWFTQACTNSAVCVPARISLATGRAPERLEALDNTAVLDPGVPTYYQYLRDHDYRVGVVGKLDLAKSDSYNGRRGDRPSVFRWGFTHPLEAEGKMHAGKASHPLGPYGFWLEQRGLYASFATDYAQRFSAMGRRRRAGDPTMPPYDGDDLYRDSVLCTEAFEDHWLGERAVEWIRDVPDDFPWHLFVSFVGPHDPFDPPTQWADRFRHAEVPDPIGGQPRGKPGNVSRAPWRMTAAQVAAARRQYSAAVAVIDAQIGAILAAVQRRGLAESTIVVVTSDHGEMLGDHGLFQKSVPYESAMRVPLIISGPGIAPGITDALIELADLGPTLGELAGLAPQPDLDALSFAPLLRSDGPSAHRPVAVCSERHYLAIRSATHKYIHNTGTHPLSRPDDPDELYDLVADPDEQRNLLVDDERAAAVMRDELIGEAGRLGHRLERLPATASA